MLKWINASDGDLKRLAIIKKVCGDPDLVEWMFKVDRPEMFSCSEDVIDKMGGFSSGQQILIKFSCDIWFGEDHSSIREIALRLDNERFRAVMEAIVELRNL